MNKINYFARKMLAGTIAVAMIALANHSRAENIPQLITVIKVDGSARYSVDNGKTFMKLHRGDELQPGSLIETAEKSTVDLLMGERQGPILATPTSGPRPVSAPGAGGGNGGADSGAKANVVRVYPSSVLAIDKPRGWMLVPDSWRETQLDLRAGQIMGNVKKLSQASRYEVKIPNGVAGIRGTSYVVSATGVVYVLQGQVIISYIGPGGTVITATVSAGESFNPFNGPNGTVGTGATAPIPPPVLTQLTIAAKGLTGPTTISGPGTPNGNPTLVHISPD